MRATRPVWIVSLLTLCSFSMVLQRVGRFQHALPPSPPPARLAARSPHSASEAALVEAKASWARGALVTVRSLELCDFPPDSFPLPFPLGP